MKKVALYIRVSTLEQVEKGFSIEAQEEQLKLFCQQHGYPIYKVYVDAGISGKGVADRLGLQTLLVDAKERCFSGVLVWKINRLARNLKDLLEIEQLLVDHGIFLKSMTETIDTSTPHGKLGLHMLGAISQLEREIIFENNRLGREKRNRLGIYCGAKIFGYHVIPKAICIENGIDSNLIICEKEAKVIQGIFRWHATGLGLKAIVNSLNKSGIRTKNGHSFSVGSIRMILTNVVYIGKIRYMTQEGEQIVDGIHTPIIEKDLWEMAQKRMGTKKKNPKTSRVFPLAPFVKCHACGSSMTGQIVKNKRKNGTIKNYNYYVCSRYVNRGSAICRPNSIPAEIIEKRVFDSIQNFINQPQIIQDLYKRLNDFSKREIEISTNKKQIQKIEYELKVKSEQLMANFEQNKISETEFIKKITELEKEKRHLEIRQQSKEHNLIKPTISIGEIKNFILQFTFLVQNENLQQKKELLATLLSHIEVNEQKEIVRIEFNFSNRSINICA